MRYQPYPGTRRYEAAGKNMSGSTIFVVRRIHRELERKFRRSDDVASSDHTSHCVHEMLESIREKAQLRRFEGG